MSKKSKSPVSLERHRAGTGSEVAFFSSGSLKINITRKLTFVKRRELGEVGQSES